MTISTTTTTTDSKKSIPSEFICPITMEIMVHPVMTRYGQCFDRPALIQWMCSNDLVACECPLTRQSLRLSDIINNYSLAIRIQAWCEQNDYPYNPNGIPKSFGDDVVRGCDDGEPPSHFFVSSDFNAAKDKKIRKNRSIDSTLSPRTGRQELTRAQSETGLVPNSATVEQTSKRNFIGKAFSWTQRS